MVSTSVDRDVVLFKIKNPKFFMTQDGIEVVITELSTTIPQQIVDEDGMNSIKDKAQLTGNAATGFTFASLVRGANKQIVWSFLSSQQLIVYANNLNIAAPSMV